jgi:hypothetical protein
MAQRLKPEIYRSHRIDITRFDPDKRGVIYYGVMIDGKNHGISPAHNKNEAIFFAREAIDTMKVLKNKTRYMKIKPGTEIKNTYEYMQDLYGNEMPEEYVGQKFRIYTADGKNWTFEILKQGVYFPIQDEHAEIQEEDKQYGFDFTNCD